MAQTNMELAKKLYADFAAKDIPSFMAVLSPELKWTVAAGFPYAGTFHGGQEVLKHIVARIPSDWEGFRHELTGQIDCGTEIVVSGVYYGSWKETGRAMQAPFVHVLTFEAGKLVRFRQFVDGPAVAVATDGYEHRQQQTA